MACPASMPEQGQVIFTGLLKGGPLLHHLSWIDHLQEGADRHEHPVHRHILRFACPVAFRTCLEEWNRMRQRDPDLTDLLRPIPLIRGFACTLKSVSALFHTEGVLVEENPLIRVHFLPGMLPSFAVSPVSRQRRPGIPWGIREIRAPRVWKQTRGQNVRIAVIDTGADYSHPDLRHALGRGINLVHRHLPPFDDNGHGTHIAGTIAARNRQNGIVGVAPKALVFPVKSFDSRGTAYISDIIQGLEWCIENNMDIINMSFGMKRSSEALHQAILNVRRAGIVVVASSGNEGKKKSIDYPARYRETISVGAADARRRVAAFSNHGKDIDLYAPGDKIESCWPGKGYRELSGTSMATAHVSGTIALMLGVRPKLGPRRIKSLLMQSAIPLNDKKHRNGKEIDAVSGRSAAYPENVEKDDPKHQKSEDETSQGEKRQ